MSRLRGVLLAATLLGSVPVFPQAIILRPVLAPEERASRAAEQAHRREAVRRDLAVWRSRHGPAVEPLLRAVDEAIASLRVSRGP